MIRKLLGLAAVFLGTFSSPGYADGPVDDSSPAAINPAPIIQGDIDALREYGKLRVLAPISLEQSRYLPRDGSPLDYQRTVVEQFAASQGLEVEYVPLQSFAEAVPALLSGRADILAANLTVTEQRKQILAFSAPFDRVREYIVAPAKEKLQSTAQLKGRTLFVDPATSFWTTAQALAAAHPGIKVEAEPLTLIEPMLDRIAKRELDLTILQSNLLDNHLSYRDDVQAAFPVTDARPVAWALRPNAPKLLTALNKHLHAHHLTSSPKERHKDDWAAIKKRGVLRVLLRNNAVSYFLWKGELVGFEYDLLKKFSKDHKLRLEVVVPPTHEDLYYWLNEGRGDIAAGFLSPLEGDRLNDIAFSRAYHKAPLLVLSHKKKEPKTVADLNGRTFVVRQSSPYWNTMRWLQSQGMDFELQPAGESEHTEELILKVAQGKIDLTVAAGPVADVDISWLRNIRRGPVISPPIPNAWAVREENPALLKQVNAFLKKHHRDLFYNVTYKKYFRSKHSTRRIKAHVKLVSGDGKLSPYDKLAKKYGKKYNFDWRLVVSQMYQESGFDPKQVSWAGAKGLMQLMPRTAKQMGFPKHLQKPEIGIHAGVKYLNWLRNRFDDELPFADRTWFILASYNAGLGHVLDARRLAAQLGLNKNKWFDNVEKAMLLLSKPKYAKKARHGFVRGHEPVQYVRNIRDRYQAYVRQTSASAQR